MMNDSRSFLKAFVLVFGVLIGLVASFNWFLDPFNLFGAPKLHGINAVKPRIQGYIRMLKAHQLINVRPHGLILGSSRAETGLDPEHPGWLPESRPVFNSALPSARIYELYHYLRHAHAQAGIRQVVVGLDEFMFDDNFRSEPGFELARLDVGPRLLPNPARIKDFLTALISYDATSASIDVLMGQNRPSPGYLPDGSQDSERRRELVMGKGGHFSAFQAALNSNLQSRDGIADLRYGARDGGEGDALKWFRALVHFCAEEHIDLYLFISPVHAQWLEAVSKFGKWEDSERWKRDLVRVVEAESAKADGKSKLELWDFSGFNAVSRERVPSSGDSTTEMRWYWEASHYKRATGTLVLDRILNSKVLTDNPGFGIRLSSANIESHLSRLRLELAKYESEQPGDVEFVVKTITKTVLGQVERGAR